MPPICVCAYPLMVIDKRLSKVTGKKSDEYLYISFPVNIIEAGLKGRMVPIPDMEVVEAEGFDKITRSYMKVKWGTPPKGTMPKRYNVKNHIVLAGCPEDQLSCDSKNIYEVYHPSDEWSEDHMMVIE